MRLKTSDKCSSIIISNWKGYINKANRMPEGILSFRFELNIKKKVPRHRVKTVLVSLSWTAEVVSLLGKIFSKP